MPYERKAKYASWKDYRNLVIYKLREEEGWTLPKIARFVELSVTAVGMMHRDEKRRRRLRPK